MYSIGHSLQSCCGWSSTQPRSGAVSGCARVIPFPVSSLEMFYKAITNLRYAMDFAGSPTKLARAAG